MRALARFLASWELPGKAPVVGAHFSVYSILWYVALCTVIVGHMTFPIRNKK